MRVGALAVVLIFISVAANTGPMSTEDFVSEISELKSKLLIANQHNAVLSHRLSVDPCGVSNAPEAKSVHTGESPPRSAEGPHDGHMIGDALLQQMMMRKKKKKGKSAEAAAESIMDADKSFPYKDDAKEYWSKCISEKGAEEGLNCAKCKVAGETGPGSGALNCDALKPCNPDYKWNGKVVEFCADKDPEDHTPEACPDSTYTLKYWRPSGDKGYGTCRDVELKASPSPPYTGGNEAWNPPKMFQKEHDTFLPGSDGTFSGPHVLTKATYASVKTKFRSASGADSGAVLMKRVVLHPHTTKRNEDGTPVMVADVYKVAWCIRCPTFRFSHRLISHVEEEEYKKFKEECAKKAFDADTKGSDTKTLRQQYKCTQHSMVQLAAQTANY